MFWVFLIFLYCTEATTTKKNTQKSIVPTQKRLYLGNIYSTRKHDCKKYVDLNQNLNFIDKQTKININ